MADEAKELAVSPHPNDAQKSPSKENGLSDKLLSDLLRDHRDARGKRTTPIGLAPSLQLLQELQIPLSSLGTRCYATLPACCKSPWEGRRACEMREKSGVASNEHFWSALVDVYARSGDYRGAEAVLDEMLDGSGPGRVPRRRDAGAGGRRGAGGRGRGRGRVVRRPRRKDRAGQAHHPALLLRYQGRVQEPRGRQQLLRPHVQEEPPERGRRLVPREAHAQDPSSRGSSPWESASRTSGSRGRTGRGGA